MLRQTTAYNNLSRFKGVVNDIQYPTYETKLSYDKRYRVVSEEDVAPNTDSILTRYQYDAAGNLIETTHADGNTTTNEYDALIRLTRITDAAGELTQIRYDQRDQVTQVTNARDVAIRQYEYDQNGSLSKESFADNAAYTFSYDENDNLFQQIDAKGQVTQYSYDADNRLTTVRYYPDTTAVQDEANAQKTVIYSYNKVGLLTGYDDGTTQGSYTYDDADRLLTMSVNYGAFTQTASYSYFANGLKKTITRPDNQTISYSYNPNNQLQGITIPGQGTLTIGDYDWLAPENILFPGGLKQTNTYDGFLRVKDISTENSADTALYDANYQYDVMSNITQRWIETGSVTGTTTYGYDDMDRLSTVNGPNETENWSYDGVGNRITDASSQDNWVYDDRDRLIQRDELTYTYDATGSLTQITHSEDGLQTEYIYNLENRLSEVKDDSGITIANYYYDPFGRRLSKTVNGNTTWFFYAQEGLAAESISTGAITTAYGFQPDSIWGTDPVFIKQNNQYGYYLNDHLGTPQRIVDSGGSVLWSTSYSAFGEATVTTELITNNLRFPGQYFDAETGLHQNYFRYYNPKIGRYVTSDPIGLAAGVNSYNYVTAKPLTKIDPLGLWSWGDPIPAWIADPLVGIGDGVTFGITRRVRQAGGFDTGYNKCSNLYLAGQIYGANIPLSRVGYIVQVKQIPKKFPIANRESAKRAYEERNRIADYYRGILRKYYRQKHSFEHYARDKKYDWAEVIKSAGKPNKRESSIILGSAAGGNVRVAIDAVVDECVCQ